MQEQHRNNILQDKFTALQKLFQLSQGESQENHQNTTQCVESFTQFSSFLRNLHAVHEATDRTGHGKMDWFKIGKRIHQGCALSPCLSNLYAEYIMRNARLHEAQTGIKIAGKNINNLRQADDTRYGRKQRGTKELPDEGERGE